MRENSSVIINPNGELGIIALDGAAKLSEEVSNHIVYRRKQKNYYNNNNLPEIDSYILSAEQIRFSNGEGKVRIGETVRGKDIFIIADIGNYSCEYKMYGKTCYKSPDEHFQDIKRTISAIGGKARRLTVIMPLLYASRQDKRKGRESLDCALALQELESMGVKNIITFDVHEPNIQNAIPLSSFENIYPTFDIVKALVEEAITEDNDLVINKDKMLVISPDTGAMDRAVYYSSMLKLDVGMFYKRRDRTRIVNGKNPIVAHEYIGSDVDGMDVLIVDDMIASGESVLDIAYELKKRNAKNIYVAATFAMFTEGLDKFNEAYENGCIKKVYSTNLTYNSEETSEAPWYSSVDMSDFLGKIIDYLNLDMSLSKLMDATEVINKLLEKYQIDK